MKIVVDLTRCQSYGQCVFAAPTVFRFHGEEALEYDYTPDESQRKQVQWAAAACPVHAISIECLDDRVAGAMPPEEVEVQP
jgi:ferredoxin